MENIVVTLLAADLIKFIIIAFAIVILLLCFVIVILSAYTVKINKEMIRKEKEFERKLQRVKDEAKIERKDDDDLEYLE